MDDKQFNSPLNQAHSFARFAESCEKSAKFKEARKCHQKAVECLQKSAEIATFSSTQESIRLQIEYHERQQEVISLKELQFAAQQHIREQNEKTFILMMEQQMKEYSSKSGEESLQWAIYKNIEEADSLINTLAGGRDSSKSDEPEDESTEEVDSGTAYNSGVKHPKSESVVIEELRTLNTKLRELISQILAQLEEKQKEVDALRVKIHHYESGKTEKKGAGEQNLIDFNSMSSSGGSIRIMP